MTAVALLVALSAALVLGVALGYTWARYRTVELLRRLNGERDIRDQAVGADLLRQLERMRR